MPAIGMITTWFGYAMTSWGYFLIRGYNVRFSDWINPVHPYKGNPAQAGTIPPDTVIPQGTSQAPPAKKKG